MTPECWTDDDLSRVLNRTRGWLAKNKKAMERDGFPKKDPILKLYLRADVLAWLNNRRQVLENNLSSGGATTEEPDLAEV